MTFAPSERTLKEWKKFVTFADWERVSIIDTGQFMKFAVSAWSDGEFDFSEFAEENFKEGQIESPLCNSILQLVDTITDTLEIHREMAAAQ